MKQKRKKSLYPFFHKDGTERKVGSAGRSQSQSQGFEGKESGAERHPWSQKNKKKRYTRLPPSDSPRH